MASRRRCKVLVTIGPAIEEKAQIKQLLEAGVDGFRFNFSHGTLEDFLPLIDRIREISRELEKPVACLADLPGPKLRVGSSLESALNLNVGEEVVVYEPDSGFSVDSSRAFPVDCETLFEDVEPGESIYVNDGQVQLEIREVKQGAVFTRVQQAGLVQADKGVNLPDSDLSLHALTEADRQALTGIVQADFDLVALSFVRSARDLELAQETIAAEDSQVDLIAKIETKPALQNLEEIISEVQGVMVARGDLGVEISHRRVPFYQKEIIKRANRRGKIVITATQMLESMIEQPSPTRAETSDVANAVLDGSDVVMLSGETAVGNYPVEAVKTMVEIIDSTESDFQQELREISTDIQEPSREVAVSMVNAAARCAREIEARAVVIPTFSGSTARMFSNTYTPCPVIALCASSTTRQKSALYRNVYPWPLEVIDNTDQLVKEVKRVTRELELVEPGEKVVLLAGLPLAEAGITNMSYVIEI